MTSLDPERIRRLLEELAGPAAREVIVKATTESTNDDARDAARRGAPSGSAFLADTQTLGRGRLGRSWHSPPGDNLYLSLVLRPRTPSERLAPLSLALGVAVARVVDSMLLEPRARLKWPNDVLVDSRKVAGILVEVSTTGADTTVIAGVGLNVRSEHFPPELSATATSLRLAGADILDRNCIAASLIASLGRAAGRFDEEGFGTFHDELSRYDFLRDRPVRVRDGDGDHQGTAVGIDPHGCLLIRDAAGTVVAVRSGEVTWQ
jgi:BirA family biotin operon repressor/biotin-[acetyl-CoA-carboxylase] ligase